MLVLHPFCHGSIRIKSWAKLLSANIYKEPASSKSILIVSSLSLSLSYVTVNNEYSSSMILTINTRRFVLEWNPSKVIYSTKPTRFHTKNARFLDLYDFIIYFASSSNASSLSISILLIIRQNHLEYRQSVCISRIGIQNDEIHILIYDRIYAHTQDRN